jgi:hypothetical protein
MNETCPLSPPTQAESRAAKKKKEEGSFLAFLIKLVIAVVLFRTRLGSPASRSPANR